VSNTNDMSLTIDEHAASKTEKLQAMLRTLQFKTERLRVESNAGISPMDEQ
jgi:hypothetical protein